MNTTKKHRHLMKKRIKVKIRRKNKNCVYLPNMKISEFVPLFEIKIGSFLID
jgi:hypothetical protein